MNVDQLVDKKTVIRLGWQGKQGDKGERGLPGVNAVENDEAVSEYIAAADSHVHAALETWRPSISVTDYNVDRTGGTDAYSALQTAIDAQNEGGSLIIPGGTYALSKTLRIPRGRTQPFALLLAPDARLVAASEMDTLLDFGSDDLGGPENEMYQIHGGIFDGQKNAQTLVRMSDGINGYRVNGCTFIDPGDDGNALLLDGDPTSLKSLNAQITNLRINPVNRPLPNSAAQTTTGIKAIGQDWQASNIYTARCQSAIRSAGFFQANDMHLFAGGAAYPSYGLVSPAGMQASNIYLDGTNYGIAQQDIWGKWSSQSAFFLIDNYFYFLWDDIESGIYTPFIAHANANVNLGTHRYRFSDAAREHVNLAIAYTDTTYAYATASGTSAWRMLRNAQEPYCANSFPSPALSPGVDIGASINVTPSSQVNPGQGFLIGYIPKLAASSTQLIAFRIYALNSWLDHELTIRYATDSSSKSTFTVVKDEAITANANFRLTILPPVNITGTSMFPLWIRNKNTETPDYLDSLYIQDCAPQQARPYYVVNTNTAPIDVSPTGSFIDYQL